MDEPNSNHLKRPPGRPKLASDEAQRAHILETAGGLLDEIGYRKVTMDIVAGRAGVSKRTLYRLFPSKTALFRDLILTHRRAMIALPGDYDDIPLQDALARIFYIELPADEDQKRFKLLRTLIRESENEPEFRSFAFALGRDGSQELLRDWLVSQVKLGRLKLVNVDITSNILMDMMFGHIAITTAGDAGATRPVSREAYLRQAIAIFLNGAKTIKS